MKRLLMIHYFLLLSVAASAHDVLARIIDLTVENMPLQAALDEVAQRAHFEWSYNPAILPPHPSPVSLKARDWSVREILYALLGQNYAFKSNGNYLIIKKAPKNDAHLSGYLRNASDGSRVVNATVYDKKTLRAVTTDSNGYYQLKVKKNTEIVVARLGYRDTTFVVTSASPRYQTLSLSVVPRKPKEPDVHQALAAAMRNATSGLEQLFDATLEKWHDLNLPDSLHRRFQISLLPGLGSNHALSRKAENDGSLNVLAGQSAGVRKAEVGGLINFTRNKVRGVQAAGLFNVVRGNCRGVQAAGLYNQVLDTLSGVQGAGLVNVARRTEGFAGQAAGIMNYTADTSHIQAAGLLNRARGLEGIQAAGLVNVTGLLNGVQISGISNSAHEATGAQVSLINHAKRIKGLQIGLVNRTHALHGVQVGLFNQSGSRRTFLINAGRAKPPAD